MIYFLVPNYVTGQRKFYADESEANAAFVANRRTFTEQEAYRFTVVKVVVEGNNTTWLSANPDTDPEDGEYQVFNMSTGQYEQFQSFSTALMRHKELKEDFTNSVFGTAPTRVAEKDVPHLQAGAGVIPVTEL
jgi:hypothetical protein